MPAQRRERLCESDETPVTVTVIAPGVIIPNTFTPNGDGINDYWNIDKLVTYPESLTLVYDRYGQKVFQSTGYAKPWDGTTNGAPLPKGTYYYVIDLKNNTPKIAGWVELIK